MITCYWRVSPESRSLVFFCRLLNTVREGKAGLDVWISSKKLSRPGTGNCPLQWPFSSVWLLTCCTFSIWEGNAISRWPILPLVLCLVVRRKMGAILTCLAQKSRGRSLVGLILLVVKLAAATSDPWVSSDGCDAKSVSSSEEPRSDTTVITSVVLDWLRLEHEASLLVLFHLSLFFIVNHLKSKPLRWHFGFSARLLVHLLCDGYLRKDLLCYTKQLSKHCDLFFCLFLK